MFNIFLILSFATLTTSLKEKGLQITDVDISTIYDLILCRSCGSDISASNYLLYVSSPLTQYAFNDTLFRKQKVLVLVFSNDILDFPVITASHSSCVTTGEWEQQESWFPGFRWRFCVCPYCGEYVGWLYEPISHSHLSAKPFFGFILSTLVGESTIESLTKYPVLGNSAANSY